MPIFNTVVVSRRHLTSSSCSHEFHDGQNASSYPTNAGLETIRTIITPWLLRQVHDFWFEHLLDSDTLILPRLQDTDRWFKGGPVFDAQCVQQFGPTLESLRESGIESGRTILDAVQPASAGDWLGLILLLDQLPRNCYRGASSAVVFTLFDPMARHLSLAALATGFPLRPPETRWTLSSRPWFYLPLMHSEALGDHDLALRGFEATAQDIEGLIDDGSDDSDDYRVRALRVVQARKKEARDLARLDLDFERRHRDIIQRFGRYPHRNAALGRETTAEEKEYLDNGGDTFAA